MVWKYQDWLLLIAVTALGGMLRFYKLGEVPPGFQFDEAFNAIDATQVLAGNRPLFLPANAGREVLYTYWQSTIIALVGPISPYTLRLGSALAGILAVPTSYLLIRTILSHQSRLIALFTASTFALNLWNIHFSHFGIRVIMMPMVLCGIFGFYWYASNRVTLRNDTTNGKAAMLKYLAYLVSGLLTGLSVYIHPTGRLVPFVLTGYTIWLLWRRTTDKSEGRSRTNQPSWIFNPLAGLLLTGLVAFVVFIPVGLEFYQRPDFFFDHAAEAFITNEEVSAGAPLWTLIDNSIRVLGMFNLVGDRDWTHNVPGRPAFDPILSIFFLIGLVIWVRRLSQATDRDRDALILMGLWVLVMLLSSVLSNDAPDFSRTLPTHPALFLATGLGLTWLVTRNLRFDWAGYVLVGVILFASGLQTFNDYFVQFPKRTEVYYFYDQDKLDALNYLTTYTKKNTVYLSELWAGHASVAFLRGQYGIKSLDISDTLVLPPAGKGALYAFPGEQAERAEDLHKTLDGSTLEHVLDKHGKTLLHLVQIEANQIRIEPQAASNKQISTANFIPQQVTEAFFDDGPTLVGLSTDPKKHAVTLFWRAEHSTFRDLTSFVHLIDPSGKRIGQVDKTPSNGSYRTPYWSPGEHVIDRYWPEITDPCAADDEIRVQVGWYELAADGARRPRLSVPGDSALAGLLKLPPRSYPAEQMEPTQRVATQIDDQLSLMGYSMHSTALEVGAPLMLDLFWYSHVDSDNGNGDSNTKAPGEIKDAVSISPVRVMLKNAQQQFTLLQEPINYTRGIWVNGEAICRRLRLRVPQNVVPGSYQVQLDVAGTPIPVTSMELLASTRTFSVPPLAKSVRALFDGAIELWGYQDEVSLIPGEPLIMTFVWQPHAVPTANYQVFVHLVNEEGQIVSQSDAIPGDSYPMNEWIVEEVVLDTHTLSLPDELATGIYRFYIGLYDPITGARLSATDPSGEFVPDNAVLVDEIILH